VADVRRGVVADGVVHPLGKALFQLLHFPADGVGDVEGVGAGELVDAEADRRFAVEPARLAVILGAALDPGHVPAADDARRRRAPARGGRAARRGAAARAGRPSPAPPPPARPAPAGVFMEPPEPSSIEVPSSTTVPLAPVAAPPADPPLPEFPAPPVVAPPVL